MGSQSLRRRHDEPIDLEEAEEILLSLIRLLFFMTVYDFVEGFLQGMEKYLNFLTQKR
jgi:hypothetical protein